MTSSKALFTLAILMSSTIVVASEPKNIIATVGKTKITIEELNSRISGFPPQYSEALKQKENKAKLLDQMIDEQLLVNAAKKSGEDKSASYKKQIQDAQKQILLDALIKDKIDKNITVTDEDAQAFYTSKPEQFQATEQRNASHILVKTEAEASEIKKAVDKGADFEALAKEKSQDPSAASNSGSLGWFARGQMVPEFEQAVFVLTKGQISGPIKTQFGYHIIKLNDTQSRQKTEFTPQLAQQIKEGLQTEKKRSLLAQYLEELRKTTTISKNVSKL
ncbi:MAG: hypothetical protein EXS67_01575 [Candidatus Margulisbacteria bacterium]|nr:hypothetical protein [Candidatus Margulisiibacteriota bacterium]